MSIKAKCKKNRKLYKTFSSDVKVFFTNSGHSKRSLNTPVSIPSNIRGIFYDEIDVPLITQNEVVAYSIPRSKSSCNKHKYFSLYF